MKITLKRLVLGVASAGVLTIYGCGGGGGGGGTASTSMTVTPSLGQFSAGTKIKLKKPDATELATGDIGADGKATLTFSGYTGPVLVEVLGGSGVKYYDEGTKQDASFTGTLRAVMAAPQPQVGVTALTNAAVVKLEAVSGGIAGASADAIKLANNKVAAAFGLPDILLAPTPVSATTGATLSIAKLEDNYALILAALAKTADTGKNATDVATALAIDMKDDKLDGMDGVNAVLNAPAPATIVAKYQEAVADLGLPADQLLAPSLVLAINTNVTSIIVASNQSDVTLAKAMFAELRTTLNSFSNGNQTGFLDTQAARMNADLSANVVPDMERVAARVTGFFAANEAFLSPATDFATGTNLETGAQNDLVQIDGSIDQAMKGLGGVGYCYKASASASSVACAFARSDNAIINSGGTTGTLKMMVLTLTASNATPGPAYSYTAVRKNLPVSYSNGIWSRTGLLAAVAVPAGSGTLAIQFDAQSQSLSLFTLNGTLPPSATTSAGTAATGVDTVDLAFNRGVLHDAALKHYHYALSGSVSTSKLTSLGTEDPTKRVTLSLDSGSYFDLDESTASTTGPKLLAVKMIGTAKTLATQFTGTIDVGSFASSKDGEIAPTSVVFNGSISDIRLPADGGAGQILTGKLEAAVTDYGNFYANQVESPTNYLKATLTFTGTVQAPSRPLMKLVLGAARTGPTTGTATLEYTYDKVKITGSGTVDSVTPANNTLTLSNQDGIQVLIVSGAPAKVTKSGATVATISNGSISYADGVTESLN